MIWTNTTVKLKELKPWQHNPRQSTKKQATRILESFEKFGQVQVIAIGPDNEVYDGHQRLSALMTIHGPEYQVDARQCERQLTEAERQALVITLHAGAKGEWDWDTLANWDIEAILGNGMDMEFLKELKSDSKAMELLLKSNEPPTEDAEPQIDRAEELREKWGVTLGQMWQLGDHRIICGDCTDKAVVDRVMMGEKADAVVTDPPYGINRIGIENDNPDGLRSLFDGCLLVMPIDNAVVIAFQSPRLFPVWLDAIRANKQKFERALWFYDETDITFPWRGWIMTSQIALVSSVGQPKFSEDVYHHDCYLVKTAGKQDDSGGHTTSKPLDVIENLVKHTDGIVYEPFSGSGTTIIACENLGRKCRAIEISPAYVAVAIQRWVDVTGKEPVML